MAQFVILSSDANLVESFDQVAEARATLQRIVEHDPENWDEYAIIEYDDAGHPVGEAIVADSHAPHAV